MIEEYQSHNLFWESVSAYFEGDPHLHRLTKLSYIHPLDWWSDLKLSHGGIYILSGGRQVGKSTSTKLLIKYLLTEKHFKAPSIFYLPCDQLVDRFHLLRVLREFFDQLPKNHKRFCLILDEATFVNEWHTTVKAMADEGYFDEGICIITGSDHVMLGEAASSFPGRRGPATKVDYIMNPLSFSEFLSLTKIKNLSKAFDHYLHCGGYLKAINEWLTTKTISLATYRTYQQWIMGDFIKRGKKIHSLQEVISSLITTLGSQITFSTLSQKTPTMRLDTFIDYCLLLERMGIIFIQQAFDQNTLGPFPKKAKKIHIQDPFITAALLMWLKDEGVQYKEPSESTIVESVIVTHYARYFPTYYIKADGEVDIVIVKDKSFYPMEIKWTSQLRPKDLKQIQKYENALILSNQDKPSMIENIPCKPLIEVLAQLS